jgi:hypothetical protein
MTPLKLDLSQVNRLLLHKQHLSRLTHDVRVASIVEDVGGLHGTNASGAYLSLWSRRQGFAREELQAALYEERSLAKVLCMRNTLFVLPKAMLPVVYQATKRRRDTLLDRYLSHHAMSRVEYERRCESVRQLLASEAKTAAEIKEQLADPDMDLVVDIMPNDWRLVRGRPRGTWRSNLHEYAVFEAWFPEIDLQSLTPEEAQAELLVYYVSHLGPATEQDFAWWAGMAKAETRQALAAVEEGLVEAEIAGLGDAYLLAAQDVDALQSNDEEEPSLFLLPSLDPYIMGYKDRKRFLDPDGSNKVFDRAGNALPTIWQDGRVIGVWVEDGKRRVLQVFPFHQPDSQLRVRLEEVAFRLSRFLEHDPPALEIESYPEDAYPRNPFSLGRRT